MSLLNLTHYIEKNKITEAEKIIAKIIIDNSLDVISKNAKDVANLAHVSHSTVSKFIKRIGFNSWNAFITSVLFEEKIHAQNNTNSLQDKINLEFENVKLFLKTHAKNKFNKIIEVFCSKNANFIFYGKKLTGNVAQYVAWNFTSNGLFGTHTYFLEELWGILNTKSILVAFCLEEINDDFKEVILKSRTIGVKVISIIIGNDNQTDGVSHLSLQIPSLGYFKNDVHWNLIQNEILRFVGLKMFEEWHKKTCVPKK